MRGRAEIAIVHKLFVKGHCVSIEQKAAVRAAVLVEFLVNSIVEKRSWRGAAECESQQARA